MHASRAGLVALAIGTAASGTWGRDVDYDFVVCNHARLTMLEANGDIVAFGVEQWGTVASSTTKDFEKATSRCVGSMRVVGGKRSGKGLCKWFNMAGDTAIGEWELSEAGEASWKWLAGTGGLKGIATKKSNWADLGSGKPSEPGTAQGCRHDWGTFTLP